MKLNCGPTKAEREAARKARREAKLADKKQWHNVFVLLPKRVGSHDCRWLETMERRWTVIETDKVSSYPYSISCFTYDVWGWEYRAID